MRTEGNSRGSVPEGLWTSCSVCKAVLYRAELERNLNVCIKCGSHMRLSGRLRLTSFLDVNSGREIGGMLVPEDFLKFKDSKRYRDRIVAAQKQTNETDALVVMEGTINQLPLIVAAFDFFYGRVNGVCCWRAFCPSSAKMFARKTSFRLLLC